MVYKRESNIFVSIQLKIVLSRGIKSRWNTAVSSMKNSGRSTKISYMLYIIVFASRTLLYSLWFARWQGHYVHATHSLFYHAYDADIFSLVANKVMVNRCKFLLEIRKYREKDKLFWRKWKFHNYRNYVRPFGYKSPQVRYWSLTSLNITQMISDKARINC